ncbi:MAG TPA: polyribonucleotide nucleotidyltransferase [Candidatus Eisenbacteria bacterium]|uniref:Polyribonucleotide nucleotidyltransferase n=1 Tax=Eiseniibacteriota bacterium TaxID=2212470 RepID=A0A7V2AVG0_UNCEI|nr:polyribonucleotide nucleotidyltransferase [Candidatus Eisenbacteria bacterium]
MRKKDFSIDGREMFFETGRMAKQADGSVLVGEEGTVVLVTAVASKDAPTDKGFFPLFTEYREKFYAAGKIPGGFFKREGRPGERETLSARLIDRPIRPLFPEGFQYEVQVACSVLSSDQQHQSDVLGVTGASIALALSDIPFGGLLSGVRVGYKDGKFIYNPTYEEVDEGELDLVIAGTDDAIIMVEGGAKEVSESMLVEALEFGHERIRTLNRFQREFLDGLSIPAKREVPEAKVDEQLREKLKSEYYREVDRRCRVRGKLERERSLNELIREAAEKHGDETPELDKQIKNIMHDLEREIVRKIILEEKVRTDGRRYDELRDISCDIAVLPRTHGSALFTRGETQSLVVTTLGTSQDEQRIDDMEGESWKNYMLHYNFPPFSVGEVGFFRGPGRREIGHGALAERAIKPVIPEDELFPYTIRVVSDILESNGSSSMATVCGGSLALMDAGVPISKAVAGIAMGLVVEGDSHAILTDILGLEDHLGDMDFKVTGTRDGVTGFQMDVKIGGISRKIMEQALEQARRARIQILDVMDKTISKPRDSISPYAPKIVQIKVPVDKIREIIGPGGKMIRHIQETSGAKIDIEDDGTVCIAAVDQAAGDKALEMINALIEEPEVDKVYKGIVRSIMPFGAFVQILPGKDGLLHISEIDKKRTEKVEDVLNLGDEVEVKVIGIDKEGKIRLSRKVLL